LKRPEEKQCSVAFDKITSTFIIRIFGRVDENEVTRFFEEYENYVEQVSPSAENALGDEGCEHFQISHHSHRRTTRA
jgi:hypothetical protein